MPLPKVCTECGKALTGKQKHTCGTSCRGKRSRRLRAQARQNPNRSYAPELAPVVDRATGDVVHEVMKEELRPVVREALTEDTLRAIERMVGLTGRAVQCIAEDLESSDPVIRQRAYTLLMKYTVGHQAVVRPADADPSQQLVVNLNLPRPGDEVEGAEAAVDFESVELRTCDTCGEEKPITEFIANSHRCASCYAEQRQFAQELMREIAG